ncbi:MAG TPA: hypothetical protein VFD14_04885 [Clostridia bacterium]|nr:hypothetical protein [Clostridia bacterium]
MEGIDRIKAHIVAEADQAVEALAKESRAFLAQEVDQAKEEARFLLAEAALRADEEAKLLLKRGESVADAERRKRDLEQKQALADEIIAQALTLLCQEEAADRVKRYVTWIQRLGLTGGQISLSAKDQAEIGQALLQALPSGQFSLDELPGDFAGGMVITHDRIRDNLTYDLAIRDHRSELARLALEFIEDKDTEETTGG